MIAACLLQGGWVWLVVECAAVETRENCFFKALAYDWLDVENTGLSSWCGNWEEGGPRSTGIDFQINASKLVSNQARASGRLGFVVMIKHLWRSISLMHRNQGLRVRWSWREIGSVLEVAIGSITANQARYSKLIGMVAMVVRKNCDPSTLVYKWMVQVNELSLWVRRRHLFDHDS